MIKIRLKKLHPNAVIPRYAKQLDAGLDLTATSAHRDASNPMKWHVGFGIAIEIPEGFVGLVFPRSSIHKTQCRLSNSVGVIDAGYRGEIKAVFDTFPTSDETYNAGDRAAQLIILPFPQIKFEEADELSPTERGEGGYGSTGGVKATKEEEYYAKARSAAELINTWLSSPRDTKTDDSPKDAETDEKLEWVKV